MERVSQEHRTALSSSTRRGTTSPPPTTTSFRRATPCRWATTGGRSPFRIDRIREMLGRGGKFNLDDFVRMQQDVTSLAARRFQQLIAGWAPEAECTRGALRGRSETVGWRRSCGLASGAGLRGLERQAAGRRYHARAVANVARRRAGSDRSPVRQGPGRLAMGQAASVDAGASERQSGLATWSGGAPGRRQYGECHQRRATSARPMAPVGARCWTWEIGTAR